MKREDYKGCSICQNYKTKYHTDKVSGHSWSEQILLNTYCVMGAGIISDMHAFKTIKGAKEYIDFLDKFKLIRSYTHITRKTHPQYYKEIV
jgi:hypothetical protein